MIHIATNPPITTNTCKYTQTSYDYGAAAPDNSGGVYAVDSSLGIHFGSNSHTGLGSYGPQTSSAEADAGTATYFPDNVWQGWSVTANLFWHIRGTIDAQASGLFGQGGTATGTVNLNLLWSDTVDAPKVVSAMSDSAVQNTSIKNVSRDYNDDVNNNTQLYFTVTPFYTEETYLQGRSHTTSQADVPFGDAAVTNDFATGDPTTRSGPQAWLDYIIWHYTPPASGWTVTDCGPS